MKKISIRGTIIPSDYQDVYDWLGMEATSPKSVMSQIGEPNGEEIEVEINSGGGSVFAGSEIYTALKSYAGNVTVKIVGIAASAASVIAMAGNKVVISPTAQIMVHNVSCQSEGDYREMQLTAEMLKSANQTVANAYALKTGMDNKSILSMMDKETWLNPQQAVEKGFADEIMFDNEMKLTASSGGNMVLPQEVIQKIKNTLRNPQVNEEIHGEADFLMQKCRLNLLKLKGVTND